MRVETRNSMRTDDGIYYSRLKNINIKIKCNLPLNINIVSYNCIEEMEDVVVENNSLIIHMLLHIKFLYYKENSKVLSVGKEAIPCVEKIILPNKVDGFNREYINIKKKTNIMVKCIDIGVFKDTSGWIQVSAIISTVIKINITPSMLYLIENEGKELFASNILGDDLKKINISNKAYSNLYFSKDNPSILYRCNNSIYMKSLVSNEGNEIYTAANIKWFDVIDKNLIIVYISSEYVNEIYVYNFITEFREIIYKSKSDSIFNNMSYHSEFLLFTEKIDDESLYLNSINIYEGNKFRLKVQSEKVYQSICGYKCLYIKDRCIIDINLQTGEQKIINISYDIVLLKELLYIEKNRAIAVIVSSNRNIILDIYIDEELVNERFSTEYEISSINVNEFGEIIFGLNSMGLYNIYKLQGEDKEELFLKLFVDKVKIICRK